MGDSQTFFSSISTWILIFLNHTCFYLGNHSKLTNEKSSYTPYRRKDWWITFIYNGWNSLMNHKLKIENDIGYVMIFICFYLTFNDFLIFFQHLCAQVFLFVFRTCFITLAFTSCFIFIILVLCEIQCVVLPNFSSMFPNVPWKFELLMAFFGMLNLACQVVSCF